MNINKIFLTTAARAGLMMSAAIALIGTAHAAPTKSAPAISAQALINAPASAPAPNALEEADTVPAPGSADAPGADAASTDTSEKIQALHEENVRLRTALESERRDFENKSLHDKNSSLTAELNQKIDLLERENAELRGQASAAPPPGVKSDVSLSNGMKSLQTENSVLKQEIALLQAAGARPGNAAAANSKMAEANRKYDEAAAKLAEANQKILDAERKAALSSDQHSEIARKQAEAATKLDEANRKLVEADRKLAQASQKEQEADRTMLSVQQQQVLADQKLSEAALKLGEVSRKKAEADEKLAEEARHAGREAERARLEAMPRQPAAAAVPAAGSRAPVRFSNSLLTVSDLQNFLGPDIVLTNGIKKSDSGPGSVSYVWETGRLAGSAEQQPLKNRGGFNGEVSKFLTKAKNLCTGSFAAKPGMKKEANGMTLSAYEIVCIGDSSTLSASVLFFSHKGLFTTIAHESSLDDMGAAMDVRDRLAARLLQGNT